MRMEREFKFRVFVQGEMVYLPFAGLQYFDFEGSYALSFAVDGYSGFWAHEQYQSISDKIKDSPIMQYVGLKDKNGKEIYESDIVKVKDLVFAGYCESIDGGLTPGEKYEDLIETVQWSDAAFFLSDMPLHAVASEDLEVIGNIYQNPELINKATS